MYDKDEQYRNDILTRYGNCMSEIYRRHDGIKQFLYHGMTTAFPITNVEFLCLQFRKTFELIILGSLVANKDEYAKQRQQFATDWNPAGIIKTIEKINPDFYPVPTRQIHDATGKVIRTEAIKEGFLTKDELIQAVNDCSDYLHAENPFSTSKDLAPVKIKFDTWFKKTIVLLNHHQVQLTHADYQIWCAIDGSEKIADPAGRVKVYLFQRINK